MVKRFKAFVILVTTLAACAAVSADDHVIIERTVAFAGSKYPSRRTEYWLSGTSLCVKGGRYIKIERYDLQKRWTLSPDKKRYFEEALVAAAVPKSVKDTVAIQRAGWSYEPKNVWSVRETQEEAVVNGRRCRRIVADGDAEYSSESVEFWVTRDLPLDIARFNERVASILADFEWEDVLKIYPPLNGWFVIKSIDKKEPPIASETTYEMSVTTCETSAPPPGMYEVPAGYQKVSTIEELSD